MPRLFLGNFDFETTLTTADTSVRTTPLGQHRGGPKRLLAELAFAWLAIAEPEDVIVTSTPLDEPARRFLESSLGRPLPLFATLPADLNRRGISRSANLTAEPWGWSPHVGQEASQWGVRIPDFPSLSSVQQANSRKFSSDLEQRYDCGISGARTIRSHNDLDSFLTALERNSPAGQRGDSNCQWVLKADFSHSARERLLGSGRKLTESQLRWITRRLEREGALFAEPWVDRVAEAGLQWEVPREGEPVLVGIVPLLTAPSGEYRGSLITRGVRDATCGLGEIQEEFIDRDSTDKAVNRAELAADRFAGERIAHSGFGSDSLSSDLMAWDDAVKLQRQAVLRLQAIGYYGPCGIDACRYRDIRGGTRLRPIQDINARWTMGRLALGWRHLLSPEERAIWQFGHRTEHTPDPLSPGDPFPVTRSLMTSPVELAGTPMQLPSRLLIAPLPTMGYEGRAK